MGYGDLKMDPKWFGEAVTRDDEWYEAARVAAIRADAFNVEQVVQLMAGDGFRLPIEDMDAWSDEARNAFPCLYKARLTFLKWSATPPIDGVDISKLTPEEYQEWKKENPDG